MEQVLYLMQAKQKINYQDIKNNADQIASHFAYMYDLNFDFSLKYLSEFNASGHS